MLEGALARMNADEGTWELWLRADDLHIRKFRLTEEGGRNQLSRFDDEHAATAAPPEGETA